MKKIEVFSQETHDFQILGKKIMIIAGYEDLKISILHKLAVKLWLKDDDLHRNNPLYLSKFIHSVKSANFPQNSVSLPKCRFVYLPYS